MSQSASEKEDIEDLDLDSSELKMPPREGKLTDAELDDSENVEETIEVNKVESETIAKLQAALDEAKSRYLYAIAETDNVKKRNIKERSELIKYQGDSMARDLLEILDDLERVAGVSPETSADTILEGLQLIASRMKSIFDRYSIKAQEAVGAPFDPSKHEALSMVNSDEVDSGLIIQELKKCYYYKDKLLRPAQVVVSNGPVIAQAAEGETDINSEDIEADED